MQLHLPIFPEASTMISSTVAVMEEDDLVHYVANGLPFYCHGVEEMDAFRHVICILIDQGLCRRAEIVRCFCVTEDFVGRALRIYRKEGHSGLYNQQRKKIANKLYGKLLEAIQKKLDTGQSINSIAKEEGVTEGAIRYQIRQNNLKKILQRK
jgi:transposase